MNWLLLKIYMDEKFCPDILKQHTSWLFTHFILLLPTCSSPFLPIYEMDCENFKYPFRQQCTWDELKISICQIITLLKKSSILPLWSVISTGIISYEQFLLPNLRKRNWMFFIKSCIQKERPVFWRYVREIRHKILSYYNI